MKKNIKKEVKPAYIVDLTNCETLQDVEFAFACEKFEAGIPLTEGNLDAIIDKTIEVTTAHMPVITVCECKCVCKKTPWYKRVWNFLMKPFKKNK